MRAIIKWAWGEVGKHWHQKMRPKHFTHKGATEYDYQPRGGGRGSGAQYVPGGSLHHHGPGGDANPTSGGGYKGRWRTKDGLPTGTAFSRSYNARKLRQFGHTFPLVWSGETKALTKIRDVRATSKGVRIVIHANRLNIRSTPNSPNMREEMTTVSRSEEKELTALFQSLIDREIRKYKGRHTVRIAA